MIYHPIFVKLCISPCTIVMYALLVLCVLMRVCKSVQCKDNYLNFFTYINLAECINTLSY